MITIKKTTTRRRFFVQGGAVLGAGVASAAGAAALQSREAGTVDGESQRGQLDQLQRELAAARDRDALRRVHLAFLESVESQRYASAAALFAPDALLDLSGVRAEGSVAIERVFAEQYGCQRGACLHTAYRHDASQQHDRIEVDAPGAQARARFHVQVELSTTLQGDSTVAVMARLQGHVASREWQPGHFDVHFVKSGEAWKIASLEYAPA